MRLAFMLSILTIFSLSIACKSDRPNKKKNNNSNPQIIEQPTEPLVERSPEEQLQKDINSLIVEQLQSSKKVERLVSGFSFGMSKKQVVRHKDKMVKKGTMRKIKKTSTRYEYVYRLPLPHSGKVTTYLDFEYDQGGLFKSICRPKTPSKSNTSDFLNEVKTLLTDWYGNPSFQFPTYNSCERYVWIEGNRHIDLHCEVKGVVFTYTDLSSEIPENIEGGGDARPQVEVLDVNHE